MVRQHTYIMRLFQIFFSVETDDFTDFFYSGSDVGKGVGYEMDRDQVVPSSEAGKPDQEPHLAVNLIEVFVEKPLSLLGFRGLWHEVFLFL